MTPKERAAKMAASHNGVVGDAARGYLDGLAGRPPRTDAAHPDSYETGWLEGTMAAEEVPELDASFFENPIVTRPGEDLVKRLDEERRK